MLGKALAPDMYRQIQPAKFNLTSCRYCVLMAIHSLWVTVVFFHVTRAWKQPVSSIEHDPLFQEKAKSS